MYRDGESSRNSTVLRELSNNDTVQFVIFAVSCWMQINLYPCTNTYFRNLGIKVDLDTIEWLLWKKKMWISLLISIIHLAKLSKLYNKHSAHLLYNSLNRVHTTFDSSIDNLHTHGNYLASCYRYDGGLFD